MAEHGSSLRHVPIGEEPPAGINKLSDAEFARIANQSTAVERVTDDSPAAKQRNKARAQEELGLISELRGSKSFEWFFDLCIRKNFSQCRAALESPDAPVAAIPFLATNFQQWRKVIRFLDERELMQRQTLDPKDPKLPELRERLEAH